MRQLLIALLVLLFLGSPALLRADSGSDGASDTTIFDYVQARLEPETRPYAVDVVIAAEIPSLHKSGTLRATRRQSRDGRFTYQIVAFDGDSLIKTDVIARYLTAEMQAQRPEEKLATQISPANYEFKLKGHEIVEGHDALVFEVKPRRKRHGLFRGRIWVDALTRRPLLEAGQLARLPSVWVKEIAFRRKYTDIAGMSVPSQIISQVDTRIIGKANITIAFENYRFSDAGFSTTLAGDSATSSDLGTPHQQQQ